MNTIFGGDTGISYEQLKEQQERAKALQKQSMTMPQNVPQGIHAIGLALMGRQAQKRADTMQQDFLKQYGGQIPEEELAKIEQRRLIDVLRGM